MLFRSDEFQKKQKEIEESKKESNWKLKKFQNVESVALKDKKKVEEIKRSRAIEDQKEREFAEMKIKEIKGKDYVKKNMLQQQSKKPEEKKEDDVYSLNPHFGKIPK